MTSDPVAVLKERLAKAETKALRHRKALQAAEAELKDLQTALRVFTDLMNPAGEAKLVENNSTSQRQRLIASMLGDGHTKAMAPVNLFEAYNAIADEEINIDTFRTTIWRMKDKLYDLDNGQWIIEGDNGLYWKRRVSVGNIEEVLGQPFTAKPDLTFEEASIEFFADEEEEDDSDIPF